MRTDIVKIAVVAMVIAVVVGTSARASATLMRPNLSGFTVPFDPCCAPPGTNDLFWSGDLIGGPSGALGYDLYRNGAVIAQYAGTTGSSSDGYIDVGSAYGTINAYNVAEYMRSGGWLIRGPQSNTVDLGELLVNPSFEANDGSWSEYSFTGHAIQGSWSMAYQGVRSAKLLGVDNGYDTVWTTNLISLPNPANVKTRDLKIKGKVFTQTQEFPNSGVFDQLYCYVYDANYQVVLKYMEVANNMSPNQWASFSVDVSAIYGQSVHVKFQAYSDEALPTTFYLDAVEYDWTVTHN